MPAGSIADAFFQNGQHYPDVLVNLVQDRLGDSIALG
jgi:hypothetical protein